MVVLVTIKRDKNVYWMLVVQLVLTVLFDVLFVSTLSFSLNLGVNGIAISNILSNILLLGASFWLLYKNDIQLFKNEKLNFKWFPNFLKIGSISGLETLVRNVVFMIVVVRMINVVGEQGTFWVANNFIWGWLLLPILQLGELIKADVGEHDVKAIKERGLAYFVLTGFMVIVWFITLPLWHPFLEHVLQLDNHAAVYNIALISVGFYVLFAFNNVIDSIFYGNGRTDLMLYQSLIVNSVFMGGMYLFYVFGVFTPTLTGIALLFAGGIAFDSVLTGIIYIIYLRKNNIEILQ